MGILSLFIEDVYEIIEKRIKNFLIKEITNCNILNEFDFQCKFVGFIRKQIDNYKDNRWKIYNTFYLKATKEIPDVLIFLNYKPVIFIEVKYYGFSNPRRIKIFKDLSKLHNYFAIYSLSLKRGYTYNVFSYSRRKYEEFERSIRNKIKQTEIKSINLNLKEIEDFYDIKSKVLDTIDKMKLNLKERLF